MANPFSLSQALFFERETATPINEEARILDFVARPVVAKKLCFEHAHSVHFCALIPFTIPRRLKEISKFLPIPTYIHTYLAHESQMT